MPAAWYRFCEGRLVLTVHVQPNSRSTEVIGVHGDAIKIKVCAQAADNYANKVLLNFLQQLFNVNANGVIIRHGRHNRRKIIEIPDPGESARELIMKWERQWSPS